MAKGPKQPRVPSPSLPRAQLPVAQPKARIASNLAVSLHFLDCQHPKFAYAAKQSAYFKKVLERLRDVCRMTADEFRAPNTTKSLRSHRIDWAHTTEKGFGLKDEEQLVDVPYQFQISSNEHGRIHGFFVGNVFYVVWLDPDHLLYESK